MGVYEVKPFVGCTIELTDDAWPGHKIIAGRRYVVSKVYDSGRVVIGNKDNPGMESAANCAGWNIFPDQYVIVQEQEAAHE